VNIQGAIFLYRFKFIDENEKQQQDDLVRGGRGGHFERCRLFF
jgi:hypothetical protein